jgi:hypothetical protein
MVLRSLCSQLGFQQGWDPGSNTECIDPNGKNTRAQSCRGFRQGYHVNCQTACSQGAFFRHLGRLHCNDIQNVVFMTQRETVCSCAGGEAEPESDVFCRQLAENFRVRLKLWLPPRGLNMPVMVRETSSAARHLEA